MKTDKFWKCCFITPKSPRLIGTGSEGDFLLSPLGAGGLKNVTNFELLKE
jgi:hypothetical protein